MSLASGATQAAEGATASLARFASALKFDDLPVPVVARLEQCILDALACCLYGVTPPWTRMLLDLVREEGAKPVAVVPGTTLRTSVRSAVLVSATAGHGFELDDIHGPAHLHCGSLAVPVALALAEARGGVDGRDLVTSIAAGYEVGLRVGLAATGELFMRGHHFQGTCGTFVAAATAARLLRLDPGQTRHALGIAGSLGAGLMAAQEGAMSKRLHCGRAAEAGVEGALLAAKGFTGIPDVLETSYGGFLSTLSGEPDLAALTDGLGTTWETLNVGFKPYATAASVQSVLFAIDTIMRDNDLESGDIAKVQIACSTMAHRHCAWPYKPSGVTAAQMNMYYTAAAMIRDRAVMGDQFRTERLDDDNARATMSLISIEPDPRYDSGGDRTRHASRTEIHTVDGRRFEIEVLERPGSPGNPLPKGGLEAKFRMLAAAVLSPQRISDLEQAVSAITRSGSERLTALLVSDL